MHIIKIIKITHKIVCYTNKLENVLRCCLVFTSQKLMLILIVREHKESIFIATTCNVQFQVHFMPCSSTNVPLQSPTLLPKASRLVWRLKLHRSRWSCCWLHCYHPRSRLLKRNNRYSSCSVPHRGVAGIHALLNCGVHGSHSGFLTFLVTVVAKNQNSKDQQDHHGYLKWSHCS